MNDQRTVLVMEDDAELLELVTFVLEDSGYQVQRALNGCEGLAVIARGMPDLILLDMKMPVMDGWEFAREFRTRYNSAAPIIVLTAAENARKRAEEIGADGWLGKPFDIDTLARVVGQHIQ